MTSLEQAFNAFSAFPEGLACFEFLELMDVKADRRCASARLSQFVKEGLAKIEGNKMNPATNQLCFVYVPTGKKFSERALEERPPRRKRRRRADDDEVIALRQWKEDAIARFPELGADPLILSARAQLAGIFRNEGNVAKAMLFESGDLDDSEAMRIVLSLAKSA